MNTVPFEQYESNVRSYCRSFPTVFTKASGAIMTDEDGKEYIDFFAGAGALNYGHNPAEITEKLIEYMRGNGIMLGRGDNEFQPKAQATRAEAAKIIYSIMGK